MVKRDNIFLRRLEYLNDNLKERKKNKWSSISISFRKEALLPVIIDKSIMKINIPASLNFILDLQISKKIPFLFASLIELKKSVKIDRSSRFRKINKWNVVIDRANNKIHLSSIKLRDAPLLRAVYLRL